MGEFRSGTWIIGITLYFFTFFLIVLTIVNSSPNYQFLDTSNIEYQPPAWYNDNNNPLEQSGYCSGKSSVGGCSHFENNQYKCNLMPGCNYTNESNIFGECFLAPCCLGDFLDPDHLENPWAPDCETVNYLNSTYDKSKVCSNIDGCTWSDLFGQTGSASVSIAEGFDWSRTKNVISIMSGFSAEIGFPAAYRFIYSFIFFWIPFFMLLWAIYMAIPFIH